jgi:hypothetical protein
VVAGRAVVAGRRHEGEGPRYTARAGVAWALRRLLSGPRIGLPCQRGLAVYAIFGFRRLTSPIGFEQVGRSPVLGMVSGCSRVITVRMIPSRQSPELLAGRWALIRERGRVPQALVWDNESDAMNAFRGTPGIKGIQCRPADPEASWAAVRSICGVG